MTNAGNFIKWAMLACLIRAVDSRAQRQLPDLDAKKNNAACTLTGVQELLVVSSSGGVVACVPQPTATGFDGTGILFDQKPCRL